MKRLHSVSLAALAVFVMISCQNNQAAKSTSTTSAPAAAAPAKAAASGDVLAKVNGTPVTDGEVSAKVANRLKKLESQIFDIKHDGLLDLIQDKLLSAEATKRSMTVDELLKKEVTEKAEAPTDQEIQTYYGIFKDNKFGGKSLDEVKGRLVAEIKRGKEAALYNKFIEELRKNAKVEILMERPRVAVSADDDPSKGPEKAPIQIVEFSDFQCPFCKRARATVNQIIDTYKDKVRYTFRDFPLSFHKFAQKAAEAAQCAGEQDKYWDYSDKLWENQTALDTPQLKEYAKQIGLNEKKFTECLDSGKYAAEIQKDEKEGMEAGVSGTPAYFINGIFISGAVPFDQFKEVIDEELAKGK